MSRFSPRSNYERPAKPGAGPSKPVQRPAAPAPAQKQKLRILFVCVGNAVRSQMAEAFARKYGGDFIEPLSAGVAPAREIAPLTVKVMHDRGIAVHLQYPKQIVEVAPPFDLVVNISGMRLPAPYHQGTRDWLVDDPYTKGEGDYIKTADRIESLVMKLILDLRNQPQPSVR